jgi:hypothetical protein
MVKAAGADLDLAGIPPCAHTLERSHRLEFVELELPRLCAFCRLLRRAVPDDAFSFAVATSLPPHRTVNGPFSLPAEFGLLGPLFRFVCASWRTLGTFFGLFCTFFGFVLSSFFGTFVDSKGLLEFVPLFLTSFVNFLRVSGTYAAALLEHSVAGIAIALTSPRSSLTKVSPTSLASQGR